MRGSKRLKTGPRAGDLKASGGLCLTLGFRGLPGAEQPRLREYRGGRG